MTGGPAGWRLVADRAVRRLEGGRVLLGGTPFRVWRLNGDGARRVAKLLGDGPVGDDPLARRLLDAGMAHPVPGSPSRSAEDVTVVIPFLGTGDELAEVLASVGPGPQLLVVDDGSPDPQLAAVADAAGACLIRHDRNRGPGAARNTGWRASTAEVIAFLDADCRPQPGGSNTGTGRRPAGADRRSRVGGAPSRQDFGPGSRPDPARPGSEAELPGWLERLVAHLDDPTVAAVAPRITTGATDGLPRSLAAYERARPPLDRGPDPALVRPGSRVPFVPSAVLVARRADLDAVGGFDEDLRFGEDVDLVWRLVAASRTVRYDPTVEIPHAARPTPAAWLRQRFAYGSSAAPLALRHGAAVRPLALPAPVAAATGLGALALVLPRRAARVAGAAAFGVATRTTRRLAADLRPRPADPGSSPASGGRRPAAPEPATNPSSRAGSGLAALAMAARLSALSHGWGVRSTVDALRRPWWPLTLGAALASRRARRLALAVAVVPPLVEWVRTRPDGVDPVRWVVLRAADDVAYGAGVWAGSVQHRTAAALRPATSRRR